MVNEVAEILAGNAPGNASGARSGARRWPSRAHKSCRDKSIIPTKGTSKTSIESTFSALRSQEENRRRLFSHPRFYAGSQRTIPTLDPGK